LDILDLERAAKVSGARFGYWKGAAAQLEFAVVQYVMKLLTNEASLRPIADKVESGYSAKPFIPVIPPVMIKPEMFKRAARLSDEDRDERYYIQQDDLYLVGSAEHTLVTMHADEIIDEAKLPLRYLGFSTSFRREAGSYGKDVKGMIRVHQFDKLEMESFTSAANGLKEHKLFIEIIRYILQQLELPHQSILISTGDMGKPDAHQVDFETWIPSQDKYRETHTADYMSDYQSRRLGIKNKKKDGTTELVHTNDATAAAFSRLPIAIMENYQQEDGTIKVPKILQEFMGFDVIKKNG
jgi:seryl-tRNA synthetase